MAVPGSALSTPERERNGARTREAVLDGAEALFAERGYEATSLGDIGAAAGVSRGTPGYFFGTKLDLFLEVFDRACDRIRQSFEAVLAEGPFDTANEDDWTRLGLAYTELLRDRDLLMVMMHGFAAGGVDEIAERSRRGMARIFATIKKTGCTDEEAREFISRGMLMNVMLSMRAHEHLDDADLAPLTECAFGDALPFVSA